MSMVIINGQTYYGESISINKGNIVVNGKSISLNEKTINITIHGSVDSLEVDTCEKIDINGSVNKIRTTSGDIECGDVNGDITTTSGDIECGNITGNIHTTSGDIKGKEIIGNVKTNSGNIKYVKDR